ncbi:hypothetical protein DBP12_36765 [Streptomyces sp. CS014]|nr:hypothetical protein DBP12_36765 [Streptomyces sp. CS014]
MTRQKSSSVLICLPSSTYVGVTARRIRAAPGLRPLDSGCLRLVRKRASGLTELLARELRDRGREVVVEHLHVRLPRVLKSPASPRPANPNKETAR